MPCLAEGGGSNVPCLAEGGSDVPCLAEGGPNVPKCGNVAMH